MGLDHVSVRVCDWKKRRTQTAADAAAAQKTRPVTSSAMKLCTAFGQVKQRRAASAGIASFCPRRRNSIQIISCHKESINLVANARLAFWSPAAAAAAAEAVACSCIFRLIGATHKPLTKRARSTNDTSVVAGCDVAAQSRQRCAAFFVRQRALHNSNL